MARQVVGATTNGTPIHAFDIGTGRLRAQILDYGAILRRLSYVDATGERTELILSFDDVDAYLRDSAYLGIIAGRYANRVAGSAFTRQREKKAIQATSRYVRSSAWTTSA
jgi:aldose 1-epimerase